MKASTLRHYARIRQAAGELYGKMPVMRMYARLAEEFEYSEETIRKILSKKYVVQTNGKKYQQKARKGVYLCTRN